MADSHDTIYNLREALKDIYNVAALGEDAPAWLIYAALQSALKRADEALTENPQPPPP